MSPLLVVLQTLKVLSCEVTLHTALFSRIKSTPRWHSVFCSSETVDAVSFEHCPSASSRAGGRLLGCCIVHAGVTLVAAFRNACKLLPDCSVQRPRRRSLSCSLPCEPEMSLHIAFWQINKSSLNEHTTRLYYKEKLLTLFRKTKALRIIRVQCVTKCRVLNVK
jgi:hypothetical protein